MTVDSAETYPNIRVVGLMPGAMLPPDGMNGADLDIPYEGTEALIQQIWRVIKDPDINKCNLLTSNGIAAYPEGMFDEKKSTLQMKPVPVFCLRLHIIFSTINIHNQ
jgi:hypothetical protein